MPGAGLRLRQSFHAGAVFLVGDDSQRLAVRDDVDDLAGGQRVGYRRQIQPGAVSCPGQCQNVLAVAEDRCDVIAALQPQMPQQMRKPVCQRLEFSERNLLAAHKLYGETVWFPLCPIA